MVTRKQVEAVYRILDKNPSLTWDGQFGFYSCGWVVITVYWDFAPDEALKITIDEKGIEV